MQTQCSSTHWTSLALAAPTIEGSQCCTSSCRTGLSSQTLWWPNWSKRLTIATNPNNAMCKDLNAELIWVSISDCRYPHSWTHEGIIRGETKGISTSTFESRFSCSTRAIYCPFIFEDNHNHNIFGYSTSTNCSCESRTKTTTCSTTVERNRAWEQWCLPRIPPRRRLELHRKSSLPISV